VSVADRPRMEPGGRRRPIPSATRATPFIRLAGSASRQPPQLIQRPWCAHPDELRRSDGWVHATLV
jgi:hypothetical protein